MRIKFTKTEYMKFISHLDLVRMMQRAFRRAEIPLAFTLGFNPHPKISFATALAIGITSAGEYMDIELEEALDIEAFKEKMNAVLPKGITIKQCKYIDIKSQALMAIVDYSTYTIKCPLAYRQEEEYINRALQEFMKDKEILVVKETNKKNRVQKKEMNIRPLIYHMDSINLDYQKLIMKITIKTGSRENLKPMVVIEKFKELTKTPILLEETRFHRLDLYTLKNGKLITPLEIIT